MKLIFYKHKVAGPFEGEIPQEQIDLFKRMVDDGVLKTALPDTPFLNEDMEKYPNDVHILVGPQKAQ